MSPGANASMYVSTGKRAPPEGYLRRGASGNARNPASKALQPAAESPSAQKAPAELLFSRSVSYGCASSPADSGNGTRSIRGYSLCNPRATASGFCVAPRRVSRERRRSVCRRERKLIFYLANRTDAEIRKKVFEAECSRTYAECLLFSNPRVPAGLQIGAAAEAVESRPLQRKEKSDLTLMC